MQGQVRRVGKGHSQHLQREEEEVLPNPRNEGCVDMMDLQELRSPGQGVHKDAARESVPYPQAPLSLTPLTKPIQKPENTPCCSP